MPLIPVVLKVTLVYRVSSETFRGQKCEGKKYKKQMKRTLIKIIYKNTFAIKHKNKSLNLRIDLFGFDVCLF